MGLSSRLFLLSAGDELHALASTAFMRMLRREDVARAPDFAGQRVRQASIVVEVADRIPTRVAHSTFSILEFDSDGLLDVEQLTRQQFARFEDFIENVAHPKSGEGTVIDATRRFVARGGSWEPNATQLQRIEAAALGHVSPPRVRIVR